MTKQEFKDLFLKLTEFTIPFGEESELEPLLPNGFKKDSIGNYYYEIGNSDTLFTTHLDTYSSEYEKVNHVISSKDPFKISTDGTTILGGDNKLGCSILISMIMDRIPGTYFFFIGEEPILSGGLFGSSNALKSNPEFFKKFKRAVAFDRRAYGSIVTRQTARRCCSDEFASQISKGLESAGINWDLDSNFGYYTDTAVFMDVIPECTNLSAGGFKEHYKEEWVDLNYTWKVYEFAKKFNWESLSVVREIEERFIEEEESKIKKYLGFSNSKTVDEVSKLMKLLDLSKTRDISKDGKRHLTFSRWLEDYDLDIFVKSGSISVNDKKMNLNEFKTYLVNEFKNDIKSELEYYRKLKDFKSVDKILITFNLHSSF
jgi:hypothetical protein